MTYTFSSFDTASKQFVLEGHHWIQSIIAFSNLYFLKIRVVRQSQTITLWSSSPEAKYLPHGETEIALTQVSWNLNSSEIWVGKGLRSFGDGN